QLPFLQVALKDFEILPISVGDADYRKLAEALLKVVKDDVIVVSSDLSHYHPYNVAVAVDSLANQAVP
ncbi:AmmeMemoRadiSam system protein B, partial [Candidatus Micrarchaeota archaeon RBG_16_49_10]